MKFTIPTVRQALLFRMEQENLKQANIYPLFGSRSKCCEMLSGKRGFTKKVVASLYLAQLIPTKVVLAWLCQEAMRDKKTRKFLEARLGIRNLKKLGNF
jgi:hypothetical protein